MGGKWGLKPYQRRAGNAYPYYKLAVFNERMMCWQAGQQTFQTESEAKRSAPRGRRCRVVEVTETGATEMEPFWTLKIH